MRLVITPRWLFIFLIIISIIITALHIIKSPHSHSQQIIQCSPSPSQQQITQSSPSPSQQQITRSSPSPSQQQITQSLPDYDQQITQSDEVEFLLKQLFHPSTTLDNVQLWWNKLIDIWKSILLKFVLDACHLCHKKERQCSKSVDIYRYINSINNSFYPTNESRRPQGMGLYHDFDLKLMRSLNNSILSSDVTPCDYFHMFQLMIHVQIVLHEKEIDYFITKGTFIGSLRHHDVIPWDTDIDIFIPYSSVFKFKNSFKQLNVFMEKIDDDISFTKTVTKSALVHRKNLVVFQYRNVHRVTSYKIFSIDSSRVRGTHYRWPKIDVFPYQESRTHVFAFPHHRHNLGTMGHLAKTDVQPTYLRLLGPLLVPTPRNLNPSLKAMVLLGQSNLFYVCEGNSFLHRQNRASPEVWRVPCEALSSSYPFVTSYRDSKNKICTEMLVFNHNRKKNLSLYKYKCDEHLPRTLEWNSNKSDNLY